MVRRLGVTIFGVLLLAGAASSSHGAPVSPDTSQYSIAIYTYHLDEGTLTPSAVFSGMLVSPRHVVTSSQAMSHGHELLSKTEGVPAQIHGVLHVGGRQVAVALNAKPRGEPSPIAILEVAEQDRAKVAEAISKPPRAVSLGDAEAARVVGPVAPLGLDPQGLSSMSIPEPIGLSVRLGKRVKLYDGRVDAAPVTQLVPHQLAGSGVWNDADELIGMLVRYEQMWYAVDPISAVKMLPKPRDGGEAVAEKPPDPEPTSPESGTDQPTEPDKPEMAEKDPTPEPAVDNELREPIRKLYEMMRQQGLSPVVNPALLDYVGQEQADLAMSYLAAGQPDKALDLVKDIEPLASGHLLEQLNYRAGLALILSGEHEQAKPRMKNAAQAADPIVNERGNLFHEVLTENPRGTFHGQSLSQADVLVRAAKSILSQRRHELQLEFDAIEASSKTTAATSEQLVKRLDALAARLEVNQHAWPGYFDALEKSVAELREKIATGKRRSRF